MFSNFAWSEMLVIACVAIIVVGPKDLPAMLRSIGKTIGSLKRMAGDFQRQFNDALKEAELDDVKNLTSTKSYGPLEDARKSMENLAKTMKDPMEPDPQVEVSPPKDEVKPPTSTKSASTKPAASSKASNGATAKKPAPKKPAAKKPVAKKADPGKAAASKPAAPRSSATRKPAAKRAAPKKAASAKAAKTKSKS